MQGATREEEISKGDYKQEEEEKAKMEEPRASQRTVRR